MGCRRQRRLRERISNGTMEQQITGTNTNQRSDELHEPATNDIKFFVCRTYGHAIRGFLGD